MPLNGFPLLYFIDSVYRKRFIILRFFPNQHNTTAISVQPTTDCKFPTMSADTILNTKLEVKCADTSSNFGTVRFIYISKD